MRFDSHRDFVNWVQDQLGPYAPRTIAEDVANELKRSRKIDESLIMPVLPDEEEIRRVAKTSMEAREVAAKRGGRGAAKSRGGKVRSVPKKTKLTDLTNNPDNPDKDDD